MQHPEILDPIRPTGHSSGNLITFNEQTVGLVRGQVDRIVASREFVRSVRMIRFLRFAVEQAILRREETLKEHLIGIEVFDRKPCYDAGADPIVRVEARRLRTKLSDYYQEQGWNDSVKIDFPLGSYVPVFFWQDGVPSLRVAKGSSSQPCTRRKALAVLPFLNLSPDPDNEYLSDGLTEELINALAKVKGMYVVARTSIFQFKGQACDIRKLGELLSVQSVVEGSVRKAGKQLRITVQLIDVFDGYHLWSEAYTRAMKDIFALQEEISGSIVNALKPRLFSASETPRH